MDLEFMLFDYQSDRLTIKLRTFLVCPTATSSNLDLIFLLDGSSSVGTANFNTVKQWVQTVSRQFNIEDGSSKIGVIQYSTFEPHR